jgi:hypothetical protein
MLESDSTQLHIKQYIVSPELYEKGYSEGRGPCTCTSVCCQDGVYVDLKERDCILEHKEIIKKSMDETQTRDESLWFEQEEEEDSDFVSGHRVGTRVVNGKCAFLDKSGRCSVQVAAIEEGMPKWALKPTFCILFPLNISGNLLGFDDLLDEEQSCCSISNVFDIPLFEACKDELTHILGEDGYRELEIFYRNRHQVASLNPQ